MITQRTCLVAIIVITGIMTFASHLLQIYTIKEKGIVLIAPKGQLCEMPITCSSFIRFIITLYIIMIYNYNNVYYINKIITDMAHNNILLRFTMKKNV